MQINQLWLMNFRNYENAVLEFGDSNLVVGANGAGKTNILEAVDILATSRSKIVKGLNKCIRHGMTGYVISAQLNTENPSGSFSVAFRQERSAERTIKLNDEVLERTSELIGKINSVILLPSDLEIINGQPSLRRKYLDIIISQTEQGYYQDLQKYTRALKQRNELLKSLRHAGTGIERSRNAPNDLQIWDKQLAESAGRIMVKRKEYLAFFQKETSFLYNEMGFAGKLSIQYKTDVSPETAANLKALSVSRDEDIRFGHTHFGVHTDDFEFWLDENKAAEFCSQGQRRLIAIAFKCAEAKIKAEKLNDPPIVLVDDVLLELDLERLNKIITAIAPGSQKIFTVTDTGRFSPEILSGMKIIKIEKGRLV
ncbi:DNA recombination protein RecF [Candidatus Termititenax spirochaetophilus]|uniref:DNA replication and repair protein RecF n=1 Tax=Candidatus Termititenax spirochaetophilus TaxID=2218522 RepID=A0A388T764_9BACT|nr:DNA recombination protein RecF [Candidatus Termititenax spirochaetophilus]